LTMDYIEGKTLEEIINSSWKPVEKNKAITWTIQIAEIIDYLHNSFQKPLVYRDLKPSNIIIKPEEKPVLVDFGIARYYNPDKSSDTFNYGTPGYAAPEQYKGKGQSTPQSDIFGLGAILFQMLTGYDPSLKPLQFPSMKSLNPDISEELESTIFKAIQLDPMNRYISIREFKEILQKYLKDTEEKHTVIWTENMEHSQNLAVTIAKIGESFIKVPAAIMVLSGLSLVLVTISMILMNLLNVYDNNLSYYISQIIVPAFIISTVATSIISFFISLTEKITEQNTGDRSMSCSGRNRSGIIPGIAEKGANLIKVSAVIMFLSILACFLLLVAALLIPDLQNAHDIMNRIFFIISIIFIIPAITTLITLICTFIAEKVTGQNRADNSVSKWDSSCRVMKMTAIILSWLYIFSVMMDYRYYSSIKEFAIAGLITFLLTMLCSLLWLIFLIKREGDIQETYGTRPVKFIDYSLSISIILLMVFSIMIIPRVFRGRAMNVFCLCEDNLKNLAIALELYATENDGLYPDGFYKLLDISKNKKPYINKIPDCLRSRKIYDKKHLTSYEYTISEDFKNFTAWCIQFHQDVGMPAGYPQYNPYKGLIIK
ncbi:MAG: serine/threonine-protein kinase, partial [Candidatus Eremiobacterota bacterium]